MCPGVSIFSRINTKLHLDYDLSWIFVFHLIGKARVYLNGKPIQESQGSGLLSQDWGQKAVVGSSDLYGFIDEFYIFTKALDRDDIGTLLRSCPTSK